MGNGAGEVTGDVEMLVELVNTIIKRGVAEVPHADENPYDGAVTLGGHVGGGV